LAGDAGLLDAGTGVPVACGVRDGAAVADVLAVGRLPADGDCPPEVQAATRQRARHPKPGSHRRRVRFAAIQVLFIGVEVHGAELINRSHRQHREVRTAWHTHAVGQAL
jgi:hypothetical protein